jgi:alanine racemase
MSNNFENLRTWADVNLSALFQNVLNIKAGLPRSVRYISVVKADAYGHGMPEVVTRLLQAGVDTFAVANVAEASRLREISPDSHILLLSPTLPNEMSRAIELGLDITINSSAEVDAISRMAESMKLKARVHVKVDTGMGRSGVWHEQAEAVFTKVLASSSIIWCGVYTHFSDADMDTDYTIKQRRIFLNLLQKIQSDIHKDFLIHADNSAGLESFSSDSPFNAVRIGLMQYGLPPSAGSFLASLKPDPVLSFHAKVVLVKDLPSGTSIGYNRTKTLSRDSKVAIVAVGYGDGVPTAASNRGQFLINGKRCPILGRVSMDQTVVDVTDIGQVKPGDVATILGAQGNDRITVTEFCKWSDSIPWEALCTLTQRVQRVYRSDRT